MGRIRRLFFSGRKSTDLETTKLVFDPATGDWFAAWVLPEERDRRRAKALIPPQRAEFKRLIGASRSS